MMPRRDAFRNCLKISHWVFSWKTDEPQKSIHKLMTEFNHYRLFDSVQLMKNRHNIENETESGLINVINRKAVIPSHVEFVFHSFIGV